MEWPKTGKAISRWHTEVNVAVPSPSSDLTLQTNGILGMRIDQPQGLLVDRAGNIIVVESAADRIDVFPPGATTPSVTVTISGIGNLAELAMQNSETTLWVSSEGGYVYSMPYPLTPSTVPTEYEQISGESNGVAVSP